MLLNNFMNKQITNFAIDPDENTISQFEHCCKWDFVIKASLMPDAHSGYVAPIGSVLVTKDFLVPAWVGYDIGCGMIACKLDNKLLEKIKKNSKKIFDKVKEEIPMGMGKVNHTQNISNETKEKFKELLNKFKEKEYNPQVYKFLKNKALSHLGSLGDGNHFIEIGESKDKELWLVIHSGSRGVGHTVATHYMKQVSNKDKDYEDTYPIKYDSQLGKEYLNILEFGLEFALLNRLEMANKVIKVLREIFENETINFELWTNKNHNHAIFENGNFTHRKGATPAKKGEHGVIPANMRDGCFLVEGLGNKEFLESSSHGAGRILSRTEAKKTITMKEFKDSMKGITGTIENGTLDEAPKAYKNIYDVMEKQKDSVKIISHIKPIINWKGSRN